MKLDDIVWGSGNDCFIPVPRFIRRADGKQIWIAREDRDGRWEYSIGLYPADVRTVGDKGRTVRDGNDCLEGWTQLDPIAAQCVLYSLTSEVEDAT